MKARQLITYCLSAVFTCILASCNNEVTDSEAIRLPEGMYPLTFTVTQIEGNMPQTRVSENSDGMGSVWNENDQIKLKVTGGNNDAETTYYYHEKNGNAYAPPLYWMTTLPSKINAWYSNVLEQSTTDNNTVIFSDQRKRLAYVLKAKEQEKDYKSGDIALSFTHQLAKVRVKLEKGSYKGDLQNATVKMKGCHTSCTVTEGTVVAGDKTGDIVMRETVYNGETYYEANAIPGVTLKENAFEIIASGKSTMVSLSSEVTLSAGKVHVITLTINEKAAPQEVNVSDITGNEYTVSGNVLLKGNRLSKNFRIIMEDGAELTLEDVSLNPTREGNAIICRGNAIITLKGENNLKAFRYPDNRFGFSGILVENGTLVINGDNDSHLTVEGAGGSGIGANNKANITINGGNIIANRAEDRGQAAGIGSMSYNPCGTITINGGIIQAWGGIYSAGIGGGPESCGDIIITGGNITAYGGLQTAAIGNGDSNPCGDITISGENTVVYAKKGEKANPSSIGWNNYSGSCGKVIIGPECKVTQE